MNRVKLSDREAECLNDAGVFQNIGGPVSDRSVPVVEDPPEEPDKDLIPMEGVVLKTEEKISKDGSIRKDGHLFRRSLCHVFCKGI